ncbi:MAG: hypothetical protein K0S68_120 [Candidatus Saccharibacteria bacterium]|jgi:Co/Zn/Cd efflux system component|nr:hypothetical protein [Candidatus Saccharibacteria bacterium]
MAEDGHKSEHAGMHEDEHDHGMRSGKDIFTTVVLLALAVFDMFIGYRLMNPALVADAVHNIFDASYTVATTLLKLATRSSKSHKLREHLPQRAAIGLCILTIVATTVITLFEMTEVPVTGGDAALAVGAMGVLSCIVNFLLAKLFKGSNPLDRANRQHLKGDAWISLILVPTAVLALVLGQYWETIGPRAAYVAGSLTIIIVVTVKNAGEARRIYRELRDCLWRDRQNEGDPDS